MLIIKSSWNIFVQTSIHSICQLVFVAASCWKHSFLGLRLYSSENNKQGHNIRTKEEQKHLEQKYVCINCCKY